MNVAEFSEKSRNQRLMLERSKAFVVLSLWYDDDGDVRISKEYDMAELSYPEISMAYVALKMITEDINELIHDMLETIVNDE
jgi:hypothetical protein